MERKKSKASVWKRVDERRRRKGGREGGRAYLSGTEAWARKATTGAT